MWLYIDPGIGGLFLQALIAGAAAVWLFFHRDIPRFFQALFRKKEEKSE